MIPLSNQRLHGRVCVIGGARGLLAEAVAQRFADEGAFVAGIDRRDGAVGNLSIKADLTDEEQVRDTYK